ncbi:hypothetical protein C1H46_027805 [Malus baccata]|uniref:Uncharacterized protein n=1 Tax=Malus baccata TaxID=106549 RepID=A0A540LK33_MALBA|nr:hypothetical protein C1H46_027805 [Malus baccata]
MEESPDFKHGEEYLIWLLLEEIIRPHSYSEMPIGFNRRKICSARVFRIKKRGLRCELTA